DEKLETCDVVRSNRTALGDAVAEHADARYGDGLSGNVSARRNKYFRRARHHATVRNFRRAVRRRRSSLPGAEQLKTPGRVLSRKLFSANVQQIRGRALQRRANSCARSQRLPLVSNRR